jgi:hypothetical protein
MLRFIHKRRVCNQSEIIHCFFISTILGEEFAMMQLKNNKNCIFSQREFADDQKGKLARKPRSRE